jgi:DNA (cytosine-5)-methyltransferase 1
MPRGLLLPDAKTSSPNETLKVLSLFTGAGGLDLGLEAAGFEIVGCVEMNDDARRTLAKNRPAWSVSTPGDIHAHEPGALVRSFGLKQGEVALVSGGPPCQPFSKSSYWVNGGAPGMRDPRAATLHAYLGVVEAALPEVMLLENVKGIAYSRSGKPGEQHEAALDVLRCELDAINARHGTEYAPHVLHLDAARYGVPQHRERVFVLATRDGQALELPKATHGDPARGGGSVVRYATAWDALAELDATKNDDPTLKLTGYWAALLPSIPEGHNYLWHTPRGGGEPLFGWRTKYWSFLLKLAKLRPSWTLQALPGPATGPFHWRNRRLSIEEMARLQTFPEDARRIEGSYFSARRQVGNAVPSAVGELLGLVMRREVFGEGGVDLKLSLIPELLEAQPRRHPVRKVPDKYHALRGVHADHPGVGKGPGALKRPAEAAAEAA